jgi:ABC-type branched-subunit amino acid transport system permease subunit
VSRTSRDFRGEGALLLREGVSRYFTEYYLIPVGIIFTAMVIFMPRGLLGVWRHALNQ